MEAKNRPVEVEEDLTDREYSIGQMKIYYDVYAIFKDRLISEFKKRLVEAGWSMGKVMQMEMEAVERSNWSKNSFVNDEVRRNTREQPHQTSYMRK